MEKKKIITLAMSVVMLTSLGSGSNPFFNTNTVAAASTSEINVQSFDGKQLYLTTALNQKSVMDMSLSKADTVHLYGPGTASNKQWKFTLDKTTNSYLISNGAFGSTQYLYEKGNKILLSDPTPSMSNIGDDTRWLIVSVGSSGVYEIVNYKTGNRIDVDKAKTGDATPIVTYQRSDTPNQYWSLSELGVTTQISDEEKYKNSIKSGDRFYLYNNDLGSERKGGATFEPYNNSDYTLLANWDLDPGWGMSFELVHDYNGNGYVDWFDYFKIRSRSNNWANRNFYKVVGDGVQLVKESEATVFNLSPQRFGGASVPNINEYFSIQYDIGAVPQNTRRQLKTEQSPWTGNAWLYGEHVQTEDLEARWGNWYVSPVK